MDAIRTEYQARIQDLEKQLQAIQAQMIAAPAEQSVTGGSVSNAKVFNPELVRRTMLVDHEWNAAGICTAVRVAGTVERRDDTDIGWIDEMAIPFADLDLTGPPQSGDEWRMNAFRIEKWREGGQLQAPDGRLVGDGEDQDRAVRR